MIVILNGDAVHLPSGATLATLIAERGLGAAACATEVNRRLVPKAERPDVALQDGDRIEVVTLVGGG